MNLIVSGCQAGDEGKGRFTDIYAAEAWAVVRYQGGPNTGHTVSVSGTRHHFIQLPSGCLRGLLGVLGNGCVVDPASLLGEIDELCASGSAPRLAISRLAHVIFPYHRAQDAAMERFRGSVLAVSAESGLGTGQGRLGSTCRGVGPCREDKVARIGLRLIDLLDTGLLAPRLRRLVPMKRALIEQTLGCPLESLPDYRSSNWDVDALVADYTAAGERLEPYLVDAAAVLEQARREGRNLLYEGAQSMGLDLEQGTYPFCSSGYSAANGVHVGTGTPPTVAFRVFGVVKSYMTQVGGGPLPTELEGLVADYIVERGREYGVVTGRRRRVGWLDLPFVRRSVRIDGCSHICVSSIDVLAGLDEVKVATHYWVEGTVIDHLPQDLRSLAAAKPVYDTLPGWPEANWDAVAGEGISALHENARRYVGFIAAQLGVEIAAIGVGPSRDQTIVLHRGFDLGKSP